MAVKEDGDSMGTVGGGLLEAQVMAAAKDVLHSSRPVCMTFSLTAQEVAAGGMLCGGRVEVLVDVLDGEYPGILTLFERIVIAQGEGRSLWLIRSIRPEKPDHHETALPVVKSSVRTGLGLMDDDNLDAGSLDMADLSMDITRQERRRTEATLIVRDGVRYLLQPVVGSGRIIIAGAGHVARELDELCHFLGLRTAVIDDRREYAARERFPAAEIVIARESFHDCFLDMEIDGECCIVIVTRGHEHDRSVLAQALRTNAGYIGMIGSRRKRDAIYRSLAEDEFSPEDLARVHCPIGIAIGARTPAEIAVSIGAELIAFRGGKDV
jgi:xanthine dehydrogenase accessory factor